MVEPIDPLPGLTARERDLPRLPLPGLAATGEAFLRWCRPLVDDAGYAETERAVTAFVAGPGPALQQVLGGRDEDAGRGSYLDDFFAERYFARRYPGAMHANFFLRLGPRVLPAESGGDGDGAQAGRAARLLARTARLYRAIRADELPDLTVRGQRVSMHQWRYLFGACRIPRPGRDTDRTIGGAVDPVDPSVRHVAVLAGGAIFTLDVLDDAGRAYPPEALAPALAAIAGQAAGSPEPDPVGILGTGPRDDWAAARERLLAALGNAEALDAVESAICCVCLDDAAAPGDLGADDALLFGSAANRWWDKPWSWIVLPDGRAGINIEHSRLDGTTVIAALETMIDLATDDPDPGRGSPAHRRLTWRLDDQLREEIGRAAAEFAALVSDTATVAVDLDLGADAIKALGVSPDAFAQLSYQVAHARARGAIAPTYESVSMRGYRQGRTEAMRVVTPHSVALIEALGDPARGGAERATAIGDAAAAHAARAKECQAGRAPQQHLEALQQVRRTDGPRIGVPDEPELYASPGWLALREERLSTSSVPSRLIDGFGFGPTNDDCIGVGYILLPDRWRVYLSARARIDVAGFAERLTEAVAELRGLLAAHPSDAG
ncbi:choline/carnitine O-acyltransferase [Naumannella huperziae]